MSEPSTAGQGERRGYLALFLNLSFMLLWVGQLISYLGDRLDQLTLLQWAGHVTADLDSVMNWIGFFTLLPFILFAAWAGPVADRYSRKGILLWVSLFLGVLVASIPTVGETAFAQHHLIGMVYFLTFLIGVGTIFFYTAKTALIPQIVGDAELMAANSLCSFAGTLMTLFGTFVASALLHYVQRGILSVSVMFYLDAASYFISGAMFLFIIVPKHRALLRPLGVSESFGRKIREALRYAAGHRQVLKLLVLSATVYFSAGLVFTVVNGVSVGKQGFAPGDIEIYALTVGVLGIGMIAGAVATTLAKNRIRSFERFMALCFAVTALGTLPFVRLDRLVPMVKHLQWSPARVVLEVLAPPLFIMGLGGGGLIVLAMTLLQRTTPRRVHGRIFALNSVCEVGPQLIAMGGGAVLLMLGLVKTVIALACAVLLLAIVGALASNELSRHRLVRSVARVFLKFYCRIEYEGCQNMPPRGGLIVAGNHASWLDTVFLGCAGTRLIHYMAASEFYDRWYFKWIMWLYGTIPVERGKGKRVPYHKAVMLLRRGRALGVFPEGRMSRSGKLQPFQGGMALLSVETGAPILPVAVIGGFEVMGSSKRFPRPRKVRVRIGQPIYPAGLSRDEILSRVETSIRTLLSLTSV